ncbi:protein kinase [Streptomyces sp. NPDC052095]|uniref:serine/threonine-protein kinase n=1 Tax=unclassified Streptomyces TaxID=2593676 RepID=UPI00344B5668
MLTPLGPQDPREISGYRLLARIGEGGMGTVYLSHTRGGQAVALKLIRREFGDDQEFRRRFEQEVQAARRVQGYHLVPVVDHDTSGPLPWLASAFVPGLALRTAVEAHGPLPLAAVFQLVGCTARALVAIHAAGVVHRDLKPGNILLGAAGPYVIDFGIARAADATQLTGSGVIGTPQFMSPEHALGEPVGPATDVFSLGLIAAVAATGRHPYGAGGALTVAAQIANTEHRPPRLDGYPDELRPLLERCLTADPGARIAPAELAALCEQAAGRPLQEFGGWLPAPLTALIAEREQAARRPPLPADPAAQPTYPPGTVPPPAGTTVPGAPVPPDGPPGYGTTRAPGAPATAPGATGPTVPLHPPAYGPAPVAAPAAKSRGPVRVLVAAGVALLLVAGTWVIATHGNDKDGDTPRDDAKHSDRPSSPGPDQDQRPSDTTTPTRQSDYEVIFKDRPFALRAPAEPSVIGVDLDEPRVSGPGEFTDSDDELELSEVSGGSWTFRTPMGKSTGATPEQCLQGSQSDVLPSEIREKELQLGRTLPVGTRLCTVTSDRNLAMLKITKVEKRATNDLPDYFTELTLWRQR